MAEEACKVKQKRKLWIPGLLLIAVIAAGLWYLAKDKSTLSDQKEWICTKGFEGITSIAISSSEDQQELTFTKEETDWKGGEGSSYDNNRFAPYIAVLGYMRTEEKLEAKGEARKEYGLDQPSYTVKVSYDDGEKFTYQIGRFVDDLGLYISVGEEGNIYLIDLQRAQAMEDMVTSLYDVRLSNVKFDEIRGIHLYRPESGMISMNRSGGTQADGDFYWNIFKPFAWTADTKKVQELINTVEENAILKRTDKGLSEEECGLSGEEDQLPSFAFYDTYDSEMTVYLGNEKDDEYVYCKTSYLEGIYLIKKEIWQLLDMTANDIADPALYFYETASVEDCTVEWQGETYSLNAEWVDADDAGNRGQRFYLNGNSITGARYHTITEWFLNTKVTQVVNEVDTRGDVLGTVTVNRLSPPYTQILTFRAVPDNEALVQVDLGQAAAACIDRNEVERFISSLKN